MEEKSASHMIWWHALLFACLLVPLIAAVCSLNDAQTTFANAATRLCSAFSSLKWARVACTLALCGTAVFAALKAGIVRIEAK